ncbi:MULTISPECIES: sensor histidine kinase [unclassified Janibacter]|uniref:sensor histidine kinase n=1 Tax=unclassified Janibacter TaxID=2649294 RepID=UPI003D07C6BE
MPQSSPTRLRVPLGLLLRSGVALAAVGINALIAGHVQVLPWALLVVLVDVASSYLLDGPAPLIRSRPLAEWATVAVAAVASAGAVTAGPGGLLLLLVPAAMAGERLRPLGASLLTTLELLLALLVAARSDVLTSPGAIAFHQRLALAVIVAFLIAWLAASRTSRTSIAQVHAAEAAEMLERLTELASGFHRGFDGPGHAEGALADLLQATGSDRGSAVVADLERRPQTWAQTGVTRQTWPPADSPDSLLAATWRRSEPTVLPRWRDVNGRDRSVLAVGLRARDGSPIGMLVASRPADAPFTDDDVAVGESVARRHETFIELAVLFAWLRDQALQEERDRLSRQMHDGIGQEIAALGYQLDAVRLLARRSAPEIEPLLDEVRTNLTDIAGDVRLHISDLRRGAPQLPRAHVAIEARLSAFRSATGIAVNSHVDPAPDALGTGAELALYRVLVAVLRDAVDSGATHVSVRMTTREQVTLIVSHDGATRLVADDLARHTILVPRSDLRIMDASAEGAVVRVVIPLPDDAGRQAPALSPAATTVADGGNDQHNAQGAHRA